MRRFSILGVLLLTAAADAPPVTHDDVTAALAVAQKALAVAQLKAEMLRQSAGVVPVVNVAPPAPVVNVAPPPAPVVNVATTESESSSVIRQVRDAATPILFAAFIAFLAVLGKNIKPAADALDKWIQLKLTIHQQERVYAAVQTAAGRIETKIDRGAMNVAEVTEDNAKVRRIVAESLEPVVDSARAQGVTIDSITPVVIGRVDTGTRTAAVQPVVQPSVNLPT